MMMGFEDFANYRDIMNQTQCTQLTQTEAGQVSQADESQLETPADGSRKVGLNLDTQKFQELEISVKRSMSILGNVERERREMQEMISIYKQQIEMARFNALEKRISTLKAIVDMEPQTRSQFLRNLN